MSPDLTYLVWAAALTMVQLLKDLTTWSSFLDFEVYPVVDIAEATPVVLAGLDARGAIG